MFYLLLKDVNIQVRVNKETGQQFKTNIGAPQGDCASAILFTYYLAKSLHAAREKDETEHNYAIAREVSKDLLPTHLQDHSYCTPNPNQSVTIDQQYADDISWITTNSGLITKIKKTVRNLTVNGEKTELYKVTREGPTNWKNASI